MSLELPDEAATVAFAQRLDAALPGDRAGWTVLLEGELGAGKSTLARALIRAMGHRGPVPSPTYTLVEPYELPAATVYHIDLYRIASPEELRYLGFTELEHGFRLIEWPERVPALAASADLVVRLRYAGNGRRAELEGLSERGRHVVDELVAENA